MFKMKYQAHRLVNMIFYGLFWLGGFLVGLGVKGGGVFEKISNYFNNFIG